MQNNPLLTYAKIAQDCYSQKPDIGTAEAAGRAVFYRGTPLGLCLAFLGTSDLMGWIADLDASTTSTPGLGRVHSGFWNTYQDMARQLTIEKPDVITGHSLGGSLALIYAGVLASFGKPPKAVYAYEPARPSIDHTLNEVLQTHGVEVVITRCGNDIVPQIPRIGGDWQLPAKIITDLPGISSEIDPASCIMNHFIGNVVKSIERLAQTGA